VPSLVLDCALRSCFSGRLWADKYAVACYAEQRCCESNQSAHPFYYSRFIDVFAWPEYVDLHGGRRRLRWRNCRAPRIEHRQHNLYDT
jgi:hypothetical protein